jgi:PAS domain S-box-containing protein
MGERCSPPRARKTCVREGGRAVLPLLVALMTLAGLVLAVLSGYVAWRRGTKAGVSLAVVLVSVAWWGLAYAVELSVADLGDKGRWGDLKYVGICVLAPAWLVFVLQYTGRGRLVTRRVLGILTIEPLVVLVLLANGATHDLVRFYPRNAVGEELPVVGTGPAFWVHLVYANVMILVATGVFVSTMVGLSRTYRRMAIILVAASLFPWVANLLYNFEVGWFARVDLTPFAFIVTGAVLVWGVFRERLLNLSPLARSVIVDTMTDGVVVLDAFGRVTDVNPAAVRLLDSTRSALVGLPLSDLLPQSGPLAADSPATTGSGLQRRDELSLGQGVDQRAFDVRRQPLTDRAGRAAGELVVLRDITERVRAEQRLQELLAQESRVAAALQASLVPGHLPVIAACELALRYQPAGDGSEIGGDFVDIFALDDDSWGLVLGDVSGKGAEAAAVTAQARYTLRALAHPRHSPDRTLRDLNTRLLATTELERHCTLVYAVARPNGVGVALTMSLAGHHQPLVLRGDGTVEPVGQLGTALGLLEEVDLSTSKVVLNPGELICLFTDGLVEARGGNDLFGSERVGTLLAKHGHGPVDQLADELVAAVRQFHRGRGLSDDLAILILRVAAHGNGGPVIAIDPSGDVRDSTGER